MNPPPAAVPGVIYQCPECDERYLSERRCPDCQLFCRRVGPGGLCPHCEEPVTLNDLAGPAITPSEVNPMP